MGHYRLFWRASRALLHPVTILAIGLSLYNDHWLRVWHPSWLTGKLSDFTWLVFAPLICLMLIVWLVPSRWLRFAPLSAFAFIGLWFATAKTLPFVHGLTTQISGALQSSPSTLLLDPTDLIALPALLVGWWVWTRIPDADPPPIRKPSAVWFVLGLALLATVASDDGAMYIDGITRFCRVDDRIVALTTPEINTPQSGRYIYASIGEQGLVAYSTDGLRWTSFRETDDLPRIGLSPCSKPNSYWVSTRNADGEEIRYRWKLGEYIERGNADTETWETIHELNEYDAEVNIRRLINMNSIPPDMPLDVTNVPERAPEPHSGFVDPVTGMVFFAMGVDGGLVYVPDDSGEGVWHWVAIGTFKLKLETIPEILSVLHFESWLALALVLLVITHAHAHMRQSGIIRRLFLFVGRWSWLIMIVFFLTPYQIEDDYTMGAVALFMFVFVALPLSYWAIREILKYCASEFPMIIACGILLACLYLLPYVFWAQGTIFQHKTASIYALILTICGVLFVQRLLSERLPMLIPAPNYALRGFTRNYPPDDDVWDDEDDEEDAETSEGA